MQCDTVNSFDEYLTEISKLTNHPNILGLFRGQFQKNALLPSIARKNPKNNTVNIEKFLLNELQRRTASQSSSHLKDNWDWLVFAQHFGLKTRLLDWTNNPLTALWFACNNNIDSDAYVYLFLANRRFLLDKKTDPCPFAIKSTKIFRPPQNNERIIAQAGWFTAHTFSTRTNSFVPLEQNKIYKDIVIELTIPKALKPTIIKKCHLFGINNQSMFPDVEGICRQINWENNF
jgi:hypothetical protein